MADIQLLLSKTREGFNTLNVSEKYKQEALIFLEQWLSKEEFAEYQPQIEHLVNNRSWDYLLDSFYQIIPFGTGGRRGEVGIGPNRINPWTIKASAQGHSQYLLNHYGEEAKNRGVVFAYDVRQFFGNQYLDETIENPIHTLSSKELAIAAAEVYAGNGIKVFMFEDIRTTPELSFAVRHLKAVGGDVFSASHNPPEHNGKKVYDDHGGQLIPPYDEELVKEVTENVKKIKQMPFEEANSKGLVQTIGEDVDEAYLEAAISISLSQDRDIKIAYTPLHGCGTSSVFRALRKLGFDIQEDPKTSNPSGKFENVTFNIPNPEVEQSFTTSLKFAQEIDADILLNSDPDSDRIGVMFKHNNEWVFINGNEIAAILSEYVVQRRKNTLSGKGVIIKTVVTTDLIKEICLKNNIDLIGNLLVGYKYVADEMNKLEDSGRIDNFLFGCEESHGYNAGNYARDKDAVTPAIWLSELAGELKKQNKTLMDYLNDVYAKYGYFRNYLTEVRLPGAEGKSKIDQIQSSLRNNPPKNFGDFTVKESYDFQNEKPIVSETDLISKNVLVFHFEPIPGTLSIKVTVRPSGTEPKIKMYYEIGSQPFDIAQVKNVKDNVEETLHNLERAFMKYCYNILGIEFPDRGFLLFWQLPLDIKLKYFEIEESLAALKDIPNTEERKNTTYDMLKFLGSDPIEKVDKAFIAKYGISLKAYLNI